MVKFHQLGPGSRFRYRGEILRKVSPLKAVDERDQRPRLIARSAEVTVLDAEGREADTQLPEQIARQVLESALRQFMATCQRAGERIEPALDDAQRRQLQQALGAAGQDLLTRLALHR